MKIFSYTRSKTQLALNQNSIIAPKNKDLLANVLGHEENEYAKYSVALFPFAGF
jgi:hypothetical protein